MFTARLSTLVPGTLSLLLGMGLGTQPLWAEDYSLPPAAGYNTVTDFGANGADALDDTLAFQQAIDATWINNDGGHPSNFKTLYIPNGTYLLSNTLAWRRWSTFRGQSRDGVVLKLIDATAGFGDPATPKPLLRCVYSNNTTFANYVENLTIDTGTGNPGAIGFRYNNHNEGALRNLAIRSGDGAGVIGLDMTETEFGPGLIKDVTVEGFDIGISTPGNVSHATFVNIGLFHQNIAGIQNFLPISVYGLYSDNAVPALINGSGPESYLSHAVLVNAHLIGGDAGVPAIRNRTGIYLRNVTTEGYAAALEENGAVVPGSDIDEFLSGNDERISTFSGESRTGHLRLAIEPTPVAVEEPTSSWVTVAGGDGDRSDQVQAAFNSGASTIFFPFNTRYNITRTITVPATVKRIVGLRSGIDSQYGNYQDYLPEDQPLLRVLGDTREPLVIEDFSVSRFPYNPLRPGIEIASNRPVAMKSCSGAQVIMAAGYAGDVWLSDTHTNLRIYGRQRVWAEHYNVENNPGELNKGLTYVINRGGQFWCLGMKCESIAVHIDTSAGGKSELLGGFFRDFFNPEPDVPYFKTSGGGEVSATYTTYTYAYGFTRRVHASETRDGVTETASLDLFNHRIGLYVGATPWTTTSIGEDTTSGRSVMQNGQWTISGTGRIRTTADEFTFVHRPLGQITEMTVRLDQVGPNRPRARAGLMIRDGLCTSAPYVMIGGIAGKGTFFQRRKKADGSTAGVSGPALAVPVWLRLTRYGKLVIGAVSADGTTWTTVGFATMTLSGDAVFGMVVSSGSDDNASTGTAQFSQPQLVTLPAGGG